MLNFVFKQNLKNMMKSCINATLHTNRRVSAVIPVCLKLHQNSIKNCIKASFNGEAHVHVHKKCIRSVASYESFCVCVHKKKHLMTV